MDTLISLSQYILHIDHYLITFVSTYGSWTYLVLFAIIFSETAFVITPFLPGDSLLFAAGSIAANSSDVLDLQVLMVVLLIASILGNKLNYLIGRFLGHKITNSRFSWLLSKKRMEKTRLFYQKHGGKTIIFARFIPLIRSFAPFVAGMSEMSLRQFSIYNAFSGILWISSLLSAGYYFGSLPFVQENFTLVIYGIILVSLTPPLFTLFYQKLFARPSR